VADRKASRLGAATAAGAARVAEDIGALGKETFAVAVDATGAPAAIEAAFGRLDRGGRLLIFGVTSGDAEIVLSPFRIYNDEITVLGSMAVLNSFGAAADLMAAGTIATGRCSAPRSAWPNSRARWPAGGPARASRSRSRRTTDRERAIVQRGVPVAAARRGQVEDVPYRAEQVDAALADVAGQVRMRGVDVPRRPAGI